MAPRPKKSETVKADPVEEPSVDVEVNQNALPENQPQENAVSVDDTNEEVQSPCGGVLKGSRLAQGLSIAEVANQLRLGVKQIEALEEDRFSALPEATIVKGFIRNYAKLLKVPAEPLVAAYTGMVPEKEQYSFALNPGINMKITEGKRANTSRYFGLAAVLLLGAGIWFFYQNYVQKPNPINPMPETVEALPELALPMSERVEGVSAIPLEMPEPKLAQSERLSNEPESDLATEEGAPLDVAEEVETQPDAVVANDVEQTEVPALETATAETPTPEPAPGKTRLEFSATQETWLSVVNVNGKEVYNKILYAGNRDVVDVWQPSEIVVGNAHGAALVVDGKTIDLAPYTRINVARVRLNR